jgi:hypothetical protein
MESCCWANAPKTTNNRLSRIMSFFFISFSIFHFGAKEPVPEPIDR